MPGQILRSFNDFSYKEKSILITLIATALVYGAYFLELLEQGWDGSLPAMLGRMIALVVALIVVHVIFHVVISLDDAEEAEDERDRAVKRGAASFGYNVLSFCVVAVLFHMLIGGTWDRASDIAAAANPYQTANLLLASLVLSELAYYGAQLFLYRRGVRA